MYESTFFLASDIFFFLYLLHPREGARVCIYWDYNWITINHPNLSLHQTSFPSSQARTRVLSQSKWCGGGGEDGGGVGDDEDGGGEEEGGVGGGGDDGDGAEGVGLEVLKVVDWWWWWWWSCWRVGCLFKWQAQWVPAKQVQAQALFLHLGNTIG